ncbi:MAG: DEAD/DEAH box helicase [Planctomycetota bacterium]
MPPSPDQKPLDLSLVTICFNNADIIGRMLDSVEGLVGEIVAVDSGSTDGTIDILRERGASIVHQPWLGYVGQKKRAVKLARKTWILQLDTDEIVQPDLARSIRRLLESKTDGLAAARLRRVVWYRGEPLRHAWQPEWRTRLVRTRTLEVGTAVWGGREPHDQLHVSKNAGRVVDLDGVLRHDSFETFDNHLGVQLRLARRAAQSMEEDGKPASIARLVVSPLTAFGKQIIGKKAYRDGRAGWLAAGTAAAGALMKHMMRLERAILADEKAGETVETSPAEPMSYTSGTGRPGPSVPAAASEPPVSPTSYSTQEVFVTSDQSDVPQDAETTEETAQPEAAAETGDEQPKKKKKRRRRRKKKSESKAAEVESSDESGDADIDIDDADDDRSGREKLKAVMPVSDEARKHVFNTETTFAELGLNDKLLKALDDHGWTHPTKIQAQLVPIAVTGKDVLGQAKTGSGKTAAFGLPVLHQAEKGVPFQALILAPTRELAIQIRDDLEELAKHTKLKVVPVYGGQKIHTQAKKLEKGPEIIVGTPGRVMDMNNRGLLPLDKIRFAVLDEVDRMFDIGFRDDIKRILGMTPKKKQTIFVSATLSEEIERLARQHMTDPERIEAAGGSLTVEMVKQHHISVQPWDKRRMLHHLLTHEEPDLTIVFCRMKRTVDMLAKYLDRKEIKTIALHGDLTQGQRNQAMRDFRHGELNVLLASDLAARGLDVDGISHVVNYDLPDDPDLYVHRIGRTARAGREGIAWSLVTPEQGNLLTQIENLINAEIPLKDYPEFDARVEPPENWKPEPQPGFQPVVVEGVEAKGSRYEQRQAPVTEKLSKEELEQKFPGGVVPKKPPKRSMGGRVRTGRGKR